MLHPYGSVFVWLKQAMKLTMKNASETYGKNVVFVIQESCYIITSGSSNEDFLLLRMHSR